MDIKRYADTTKLFQNAKNKLNVTSKTFAQKTKANSKIAIDDTNKENVGQSQAKAPVYHQKIVRTKGHESYLPNILAHLHATSGKNIAAFDAMERQTEINRRMRAILFNWLLEIVFKYGLKIRTIFLTANILDRYLQFKNVERSQLQLVGVTCLLMASKYEDIYPPELKDLYRLCDKVYTPKQILKCETEILACLNFDFVFVSGLDVAELKAKLSGVQDKRAEEAAELVLHIFLFHSNISKFNAFVLADFARVVGGRLIGSSSYENNSLTAHEMKSLTDDFCEIVKVIKSDKLHSLETKYSSLFAKLLSSVFN